MRLTTMQAAMASTQLQDKDVGDVASSDITSKKPDLPKAGGAGLPACLEGRAHIWGLQQGPEPPQGPVVRAKWVSPYANVRAGTTPEIGLDIRSSLR